jgi:hypothetical protein
MAHILKFLDIKNGKKVVDFFHESSYVKNGSFVGSIRTLKRVNFFCDFCKPKNNRR